MPQDVTMKNQRDTVSWPINCCCLKWCDDGSVVPVCSEEWAFHTSSCCLSGGFLPPDTGSRGVTGGSGWPEVLQSQTRNRLTAATVLSSGAMSTWNHPVWTTGRAKSTCTVDQWTCCTLTIPTLASSIQKDKNREKYDYGLIFLPKSSVWFQALDAALNRKWTASS